MEVRELRYFLAAAREENITHAAETLHITQPSLSKQLMELEKKLGKKLFIRGKKKIMLTEEGILLRKRAEEIVELVEKTEQEISSENDQIVGNIYLGGSTPNIVLQAATQIRKKYPEVKFNFYSGDAVEVSERLNHGSLDFAVMLQPIDNVKYDFISLPEHSEWGMLMPKTDSLTGKGYITKDDIKSIPIIMHQRIGLQNEIAHWAGINIEDLNIVATYNVVHGSPICFVQNELGYFLTTREMLAPKLDDSVCFLPLKPQIPTQLALVWKKHAVFSNTSKVFMKKIEELLQ